MKTTKLTNYRYYKNTNGLEFNLSWQKMEENPVYSYRLYIVFAECEDRNKNAFHIAVVKQQYPTEQEATSLVTNYITTELIQKILDEYKNGSTPYVFSPHLCEGWFLF